MAGARADVEGLYKMKINIEAPATAADPSSIDVICRLGGKGQVTPVKHTWG